VDGVSASVIRNRLLADVMHRVSATRCHFLSTSASTNDNASASSGARTYQDQAAMKLDRHMAVASLT
jgi:hypothetical protein